MAVSVGNVTTESANTTATSSTLSITTTAETTGIIAFGGHNGGDVNDTATWSGDDMHYAWEEIVNGNVYLSQFFLHRGGWATETANAVITSGSSGEQNCIAAELRGTGGIQGGAASSSTLTSQTNHDYTATTVSGDLVLCFGSWDSSIARNGVNGTVEGEIDNSTNGQSTVLVSKVATGSSTTLGWDTASATNSTAIVVVISEAPTGLLGVEYLANGTAQNGATLTEMGSDGTDRILLIICNSGFYSGDVGTTGYDTTASMGGQTSATRLIYDHDYNAGEGNTDVYWVIYYFTETQIAAMSSMALSGFTDTPVSAEDCTVAVWLTGISTQSAIDSETQNGVTSSDPYTITPSGEIDDLVIAVGIERATRTHTIDEGAQIVFWESAQANNAGSMLSVFAMNQVTASESYVIDCSQGAGDDGACFVSWRAAAPQQFGIVVKYYNDITGD